MVTSVAVSNVWLHAEVRMIVVVFAPHKGTARVPLLLACATVASCDSLGACALMVRVQVRLLAVRDAMCWSSGVEVVGEVPVGRCWQRTET